MEFQGQQAKAVDEVAAWLKGGEETPQTFYLAGYAGTGKTTLARHLAALQGGMTYFMAYTGKAASVMRRKGCPNVSTIHSAIYQVVPPDEQKLKDILKQLELPGIGKEEQAKLKNEFQENNRPKFALNRESDIRDASLLVLDECSMVDETLGTDLLSFGVKVLVLGDPGQLPPVGGEGYFTKRKPDFLLTEIHRQALGNPIINMATMVRQGHKLKFGAYGNSKCVYKRQFDRSGYADPTLDQVIVGRNVTRGEVNSIIRDYKGFTGLVPLPDEKIICLKNNKELGLFNGTQWKVLESQDLDFPKLRIVPWDDQQAEPITAFCHPFDSDYRNMPFWQRSLADEFDFGYAITCHKSQGSQWTRGLIVNESYCFGEHQSNWLYTALTRMEEEVTVLL